MKWNYEQPVKIIFGNGSLENLSKITENYKNILLVSDPFFKNNGLIDRIKNIIGNIFLFTDISPNPDVYEVNLCSSIIKKNNIDLIIALGGGSSLDLAKAASIAVDDIVPYHNGNIKVLNKSIPLIAIPTTSGTGSEVTCVSVLTNRQTGKKSPIVSKSFYPIVAIIDPELTYSLSPYMTASTGIDVLCHGVEGFWSKGHQPICDALALKAIKLVLNNLRTAYKEPFNKEAREKLAEASLMAGLAFTLPKTTSSHACSFPLTSIYHIPHGEACGLTLDYFVRINKKDKHTIELTKELGYINVDEFADEILKLKKDLNLRTNLYDFNIDNIGLKNLVNLSHHPNLKNNPVEITDDILIDMYKYLIEGEN
ncbi:MAG: iron-containing alcohol dehydrogenase family protein [Lachnospirales bacterium]